MDDLTLFVLGGNPAAIRASAGDWLEFSVDASAAALEIAALAPAGFHGDEGVGFGDLLTVDAAPRLTMAGDAWGQVATALTSYADELETAQSALNRLAVITAQDVATVASRQADVRTAQAADVRARAYSAEQTPCGATPLTLHLSAPPPWVSGTPTALSRLAEAHSSLTAVQTKARLIRLDHELALLACTAAVNAARMLAPAPPPNVGTLAAQTLAGWTAQASVPSWNTSAAIGRKLKVAAAQSAFLPLGMPLNTAAAAVAVAPSSEPVGDRRPTGWAAMPMGLRAGGAAVKRLNDAFDAKWDGTGDPPGWVFNAGRHLEAQGIAVKQLQSQVAVMGGNPANVKTETPIPNGSKNGSGADGRADITYDDGKNIYVWEVKGTTRVDAFASWSADKLASAETAAYIKNLQKTTTESVRPGFPMAHPVEVPYLSGRQWELLNVRSGTGPGSIVYTSIQYDNHPEPRVVPDPVPVPEPKPVPVTDPPMIRIQRPPPLLHQLLPAVAAGGFGAVLIRVGAGLLLVLG